MRLPSNWIKKVATKEGVRRVPISHISMTGEVLGSEFESALERDLIMTCAFDGSVNWFQSQPLTVNYQDAEGKPRHYTPDLVIHFGTDQKTTRCPMLCEVKYREELLKNWKTYKPKFKAARAYARENDMEFRIFDEQRIRTPRLKNIQFLWRYKYAPVCSGYQEELLAELSKLDRGVQMLTIIDKLYPIKEHRGEAIWAWWTLVVQGAILCDLNQRLDNSTLFWVPEWRKSVVSWG